MIDTPVPAGAEFRVEVSAERSYSSEVWLWANLPEAVRDLVRASPRDDSWTWSPKAGVRWSVRRV